MRKGRDFCSTLPDASESAAAAWWILETWALDSLEFSSNFTHFTPVHSHFTSLLAQLVSPQPPQDMCSFGSIWSIWIHLVLWDAKIGNLAVTWIKPNNSTRQDSKESFWALEALDPDCRFGRPEGFMCKKQHMLHLYTGLHSIRCHHSLILQL